jgi:hypothetical protein
MWVGWTRFWPKNAVVACGTAMNITKTLGLGYCYCRNEVTNVFVHNVFATRDYLTIFYTLIPTQHVSIHTKFQLHIYNALAARVKKRRKTKKLGLGLGLPTFFLFKTACQYFTHLFLHSLYVSLWNFVQLPTTLQLLQWKYKNARILVRVRAFLVNKIVVACGGCCVRWIIWV